MPLILAHTEGLNSITIQCRASVNVGRVLKKILIKKLKMSDLGFQHHILSPQRSKILLNMSAFWGKILSWGDVTEVRFAITKLTKLLMLCIHTLLFPT